MTGQEKRDHTRYNCSCQKKEKVTLHVRQKVRQSYTLSAVTSSFLHSEEIQIGPFTRSSSSTQPMVSVFSFSKQCRWRFVALFALSFSEK